MIHRTAQKQIENVLKFMRVVLIHGARQVGKTTLARQLTRGPTWSVVSLDEASACASATADPENFLSQFSGPVLIDEVQRVPGLYRAIKRRVDSDNQPGQYLLTGSAHALLLPGLADALAGRVGIMPLWPLSQGEIAGREERFIDGLFVSGPLVMPRSDGIPPDIVPMLVRGGYPEALGAPSVELRRAWFESYIQTVLERDVKSLASIEAVVLMPDLLRLVASRAGGLLNLADLSRSLSMPHATLTRYLALLHATFLVHRVSPWMSNRGLRLSKAPKVFIGDSGLCSHLLGTDENRLRNDRGALGPLLENFVAMELRKQIDWSATKPGLYHFRTHAGREVDFVLEAADGRVVGIEVKAGMGVGTDDFKGLYALRDAVGKNFVRGVVLHLGPSWAPFGTNMMAMPVSALWSEHAAAARE